MPKLKDRTKKIAKTTSLDQLPLEAKDVFVRASTMLRCSPEDLWTKSRKREVVDARHISMMLIWEFYGSYGSAKGLTLKTVASFYNRHHASLIHAIEKTQNLLKTNPNYSEKYYRVKSSIKLRPNIGKIIGLMELLTVENAIEAEEYIIDLMNQQTIKANEQLKTT
jgi:hypothetical protein